MPNTKQSQLWLIIFSVIISFIYPQASYSSEQVEAAKNEFVDSLFGLSFEDLLNIKVVSATKNEVRLSHAPAIISVVTFRDMSTYNLRSIADVLKTQPGFDVLYDLSLYNAGVRGVSGGLNGQSKVIKVMIDGQDMAFRPTTGNFIGPEFIPTIAIDRIEIIRGPLSALYGANAFMGTVNVIPQSARSMTKYYQGNSLLQFDAVDTMGNMGFETQLASWGNVADVDLFAAILTLDKDRSGLALPQSSPRLSLLSEQNSIVTQQDDERSLSFYARAFKQSEHEYYSLDFSYQNFERQGNFQPDSEPLRNAVLGFSNSMARFQYKKTISERWAVNSSFAGNWGRPIRQTRHYDPFRFNVDYVRQDYQSTQYSSSAELNYTPALDWYFLLGIDYSFDKEELPELIIVDINGERSVKNSARSGEIDNLGFYLQASFQATEELNFIINYRNDHHSLFDNQNNYRLGLVYSYSPDTTFKLLAGSSFKAPSVLLMFGGEHTRLLGPLANSGLKPQQNKTTELSVGHKITDNSHFSLTLYHSLIKDFAEFDTLASNPQAKNRGEISSQGLEFSYQYKNSQAAIEAFVSLSYVKTDVSTDAQIGITVSTQSRLFPKTSGSMGIAWQLQALPIKLVASYYVIDQRAADKSNLPLLPPEQQQEYFLPSYQILDMGIETTNLQWVANRSTKISLTFKNLLDKSFVEPGFLGIDTPGLGRQIYLGLQQSF